MIIRLAVYLFLGVCIWVPVLGLAQTQMSNSNTIVVKDRQFFPPKLIITAGKKLQITVDNQDTTAEEFESFDLDREQIVEGRHKTTVFIGPLKAGAYKYWGDFHADSAKGVLIAQ